MLFCINSNKNTTMPYFFSKNNFLYPRRSGAFCPLCHSVFLYFSSSIINLANNYSSRGALDLIFYMSISCDKTFPWVPTFFILWPWPKSLTYLSKLWPSQITFNQWVKEPWYFTCIFFVKRPFCGYQHFLLCDLRLGVW